MSFVNGYFFNTVWQFKMFWCCSFLSVTSCKLSASLPSKVSVFTNYILLEITDITLFNQLEGLFTLCDAVWEERWLSSKERGQLWGHQSRTAILDRAVRNVWSFGDYSEPAAKPRRCQKHRITLPQRGCCYNPHVLANKSVCDWSVWHFICAI